MEQQRLERERLEAVLGADTFFFWVVQKQTLQTCFRTVTCRSSESVSSWCKRISRHSRRRNRLRLWSLRTQWCHQCLPRPCHPWRRHGGSTDLGWNFYFFRFNSLSSSNDKELNMESCWKSLSIGFHAVPSPACQAAPAKPPPPMVPPVPAPTMSPMEAAQSVREIAGNWGEIVYGCFLKMVVLPKHPKVIIFSRKTHGCWVPPF